MRGKILGDRYRIQNRIGEGGMAYVYVAIDEKLNRKVAIKILHKHMADNPEIRQRFYYEARAISALDHRNILKIYDFSGENSEELWIVTEILKGVNLGEYVRTFPGKWLHPVIATCMVEEILSALSAAHAQNIIHRDIKPENIMVLDGGKIKLMDFGIAKNMEAHSMTVTGAFMGSPSYMSPEQVRGRSIDHRSDLYSLGVLFYEIVTGQLPFVGGSTHDVVMKICEGKFTEPSHLVPNLPEALNKTILKAMAKHFSRRYQDAASFAKDTREFLASNGFEESHIELERYFTDPDKVIARLKNLSFTNAGNTKSKMLAAGQNPLHHKTTKNQAYARADTVLLTTQMSNTKAMRYGQTRTPSHALPAWQTTRKDHASAPRQAAHMHFTRKTVNAPNFKPRPMPASLSEVKKPRARPRHPKRTRHAQALIGVYTQYRVDNFSKLMGILLVAMIMALSIIGFWQAQSRLAKISPKAERKVEVAPPPAPPVRAIPQERVPAVTKAAPVRQPRVKTMPRQVRENQPSPALNPRPASPPPINVVRTAPAQAPKQAVAKGPAEFQITAEPAAEVFVNGRKMGTTVDQTISSAWIKLPAGEHILELRRPGYKTYTTALLLRPGEKRSLGKIELKVQARSKVSFTANEQPTKVQIESVDGVLKKTFTLQGQMTSELLAWGRYRVRLEHKGKIINRVIDINAQTPEIRVDVDFSLDR